MSAPTLPVERLLACGVDMPAPATVHIDESVDPARIAPGVTIHPGCRISGAMTSIGPGSELGREAPLTLIDSQLGADVKAAGGFIEGATLMDGVSLGTCAHVRPGCLLEEYASAAHAVGLKQTLLLPFVTLGSTINFCDIMMAGGTGPKNHSEVGSSYIHFNFTPHQDKATASMAGDIPAGIMLDQPPIFLGGQGGLVGPARIAYGSIIAAGTIHRGDILEPGLLHFAPPPPVEQQRPYDPEQFGTIAHIIKNNLLYVGNLRALQAWYIHVRPRLMTNAPHTMACLEGARQQLARMLEERLKRLDQLIRKVTIALEDKPPQKQEIRRQHQRIVAHWPNVRTDLEQQPDASPPESLLHALPSPDDGTRYTDLIQAFPQQTRQHATTWLQSLVTPLEIAARRLTHE